MTEDQNTTCWALSEDCLAPAPKPLTVSCFATVILEKAIQSNGKGLEMIFYASIIPALTWFEIVSNGETIDRCKGIDEAVKAWNLYA